MRLPLRPAKAVAACLLLATCQAPADWPTFGGDTQRSGWARRETIIDKTNVGTLELKWKLQLDNAPRELTSLTPPVVADNVKTIKGQKEYVIVGGSSDNLFAIDADTGKLAWTKHFSITATPNRKSNTLCPYALNATPVVQVGRPRTVYAISSDGKLHALNTVNGEDRFAPKQFVPPFSKNWSLNLAGGVLYTAVSQRCNGTISGVYGVDLSDPEQPVRAFETGRPGIWGRAGVVVSGKTGNIFAQTGDGAFEPSEGSWGDSFLALSPKDLKLVDYYVHRNRAWLTRKDLDMGNITPAVFTLGDREYLVGGGKEGRLFILDTQSLGGDDHRTPAYRSELILNEDVAYAAQGFWGAFATFEDEHGARWLYAPAWGPPHPAAHPFAITNGDAPHGSIMAFRVEAPKPDAKPADAHPTLTPVWISGDMNVPEPPIIANGIVFALSSGEDVFQADSAGNGLETAGRVKGSTHAILKAFDAQTGKELFSSGDTMKSFAHFGGIAISNGRVFATTYDGYVYAFGIRNEER